jgi:hypothetical protein
MILANSVRDDYVWGSCSFSENGDGVHSSAGLSRAPSPVTAYKHGWYG